MKTSTVAVVVLSALLVTACHKKAPALAETPAAAPAPAPQSQAESTADDRETARKRGKLDYATMEDHYLNDPRAQWAASATASSTFGDANGKTPSDSDVAGNATGALDDKTWTNGHGDIGFDTLVLGYAKPVHATEVRIVCEGREAVASISKLELQDDAGAWSTVWSGLSEVAQDQRGPRTWFVRTFDKTANPVKAVRVTFANNVEPGYKVVNAAQLVGD